MATIVRCEYCRAECVIQPGGVVSGWYVLDKVFRSGLEGSPVRHTYQDLCSLSCLVGWATQQIVAIEQAAAENAE
jgi:hypothetical protein